jgi:rod shape-determining protein MreC
VLDVPVRRGEGLSSRSGRVFRARLVAALLVLVSLGLITVYFRESSEGPLHAAQRIGVSVLMPFEVAGERVSRPFRDGWAYVSDLLDAKSENERLREENEELRQSLIAEKTAAQENVRLEEIATYVTGPEFPASYEPVVATVIGRPPTPYQQEIVIAAGSDQGVKLNAPVVTPDGLVGRVTDVTDGSAKVTLITDPSSAVSAVVLADGASEAPGIVEHGASPASLVLDKVGKDELVKEGNVVITAGWRTGRFESLYPRGIAIGTVESVGQQDVDLYKRIQITPLVDFDSLAEVIVLLEKPRPAQGPPQRRGAGKAKGAGQGQSQRP